MTKEDAFFRLEGMGEEEVRIRLHRNEWHGDFKAWAEVWIKQIEDQRSADAEA